MEHIRSVTVSVIIETNKGAYKTTCPSIVSAVDYYNKTLNCIHDVSLNDFPLFKDECQEVDYYNAHTDAMATQLLKHFDNPKGTFGSDKLNEIVKRHATIKARSEFYFNLLVILMIGALILIFSLYASI